VHVRMLESEIEKKQSIVVLSVSDSSA
jgi:hypothetical protein